MASNKRFTLYKIFETVNMIFFVCMLDRWKLLITNQDLRAKFENQDLNTNILCV